MKRTFLLFFCFTTIIYGQGNLSLSDAINNSLKYNYDIRITKQDQKAAEINNSWGAAGRFPMISFDVTSNNQRNLNEEQDYTVNTINPGISLNWLLFDGFSIRMRKQKFEYLSELSQGNTSLVIENTVRSVIAAYYNILLQHEKLLVLKEVMDLSKDRYDYTMTKKEIGSAVTYDVLQAKNAWLEDKANFLLQEVTFTNAVKDLNYLMGITGDTLYTLTDEFDAPLNDYEQEMLLSKMLENNKTLKNQYINQTILQKNIDIAKSAYLPYLTLNTGADAFKQRTKNDGIPEASAKNSQNLYANLILGIDIFDGGIRRRALDVAKIDKEVSSIETIDMKHSLTIQLEKLFGLYNVRKNLYDVARENLEAANLNMQISRDKFHAGTINSFNYRDVQLIYLNASLNRLNAIYNLIDTNTEIQRITGGIITEY